MYGHVADRRAASTARPLAIDFPSWTSPQTKLPRVLPRKACDRDSNAWPSTSWWTELRPAEVSCILCSLELLGLLLLSTHVFDAQGFLRSH